MFYYPNVLQRHTGCFSTIWLAATCNLRVSRREFLKVNVNTICGDILDYVTARVPALRPNEPKPRFSLYLSSQLQYGVVVVYHKQCGILLEETQTAIDRLVRTEALSEINLKEQPKLPTGQISLTDNVWLMQETEGALDPYFGLLGSDQLPTPFKIPKVDMLEIDYSLSEPSSEGSSHRKKGSPLLLETETYGNGAEECFVGKDLPEATVKDIELLMNQDGQVWRVDEQPVKEEAGEIGNISFNDQPQETDQKMDIWVQAEKMGLPVGASAAAVLANVTPSDRAEEMLRLNTPLKSHSGSAGTPNGEAFPPPMIPGRKRRRQLIFADPEIQIIESEMQRRLEMEDIETQNLINILLLDIEAVTSPSASQLFLAPNDVLIHNDLQSLWKQRARITATLKAEEDLEPDVEIPRKERKEKRTEASGGAEQQSMGSLSVSDVQFEVSKEEKSGSEIITPISSRWSPPQEEGQTSMAPIVEENIEIPKTQTSAENWNFLRYVTSSLQTIGKVTFDSLLPPKANRGIAALTLYKLLELLSARELIALQMKPYSTIILEPPNNQYD